MYIEVSYVPEYPSETKSEDKKQRKQVLNYIKEVIEFDFHERYKIKIKELIFEEGTFE